MSFVLSMPIAGQSIDKALQLLKNKKLEPLKEFIDQSKGGYVHLEIFRDIIPGYQEGVLSIAEPKNLIQCSSKLISSQLIRRFSIIILKKDASRIVWVDGKALVF